ncbi:MAG: GUN4 domain-containing protein [Pseudanabaenaceae cyanobacterium bins.68]|nr:GUN4 domain-containing protein [Pseudanabaenaceae cyanobacterium bins.68]
MSGENMNGENNNATFLIETNLGNGASLLTAPTVVSVDGESLKQSLTQIIDLVQQLEQNSSAKLALDQVDLALKVTPTGQVVIAAAATGITLRFRPAGTSAPVVRDRYHQLEQFLANSQWEAANRETWDLLCFSLNKSVGTHLNALDIEQIPCDVIRRLDQLWQRHSQGRFGFTVQQQIYQSTASK